jgi:hypothetical protein
MHIRGVVVPGSSTRIELVITCRIAVLWKNGAAPIVVPGIRVVTVMSLLAVREAIWTTTSEQFRKKYTQDKKERRHTRESPGEGLASVLIIRVSFSDW